MKTLVLSLAVASLAGVAAAEPVEVKARDGYALHGQLDRPAGEDNKPRVVVLMVPGTGLFDRDVSFGRSGTEADKLFKDLSNRITARGVATLRYDLRGVGYGDRAADMAVLRARTTDSMRDDVDDLQSDVAHLRVLRRPPHRTARPRRRLQPPQSPSRPISAQWTLPVTNGPR